MNDNLKEKEEKEKKAFDDIFDEFNVIRVEDALEFSKSKRSSRFSYKNDIDLNTLMTANLYRISNDFEVLSLYNKICNIFLPKGKRH